MDEKRRKSKRSRSAVVFLLALFILASALVAAVLFVFPGLLRTKETPREPLEEKTDFVSAAAAGGRELRGLYVATVGNLNFPSRTGLTSDELRAEIDAMIALCERVGFNTLIFQARPASDAFYESGIYPSSYYLTGEQGADPPFDVLAELTAAAHQKDIAVIAWVNPYRVQKTGAFELSAGNPAALHPEYCVEYGGVTYYDPGLPEVREMIARGCAEIASGYDVDGILFDDYFYPYPKDGEAFDDAATYAKYGGGAALADWRRENVNETVRLSYEAVKAADPICSFGIAPFGIWSNDNGRNGGSQTRGLDAYNDIFCDALAWAKEGYVDFLAPQIYWSFDTDVARYDLLCDWWADALRDTGVVFLTSNAAYKVSEWTDDLELAKQIGYNRSTGACAGEFIYGYAALAANENDVIGCLSSAFDDNQ